MIRFDEHKSWFASSGSAAAHKSAAHESATGSPRRRFATRGTRPLGGSRVDWLILLAGSTLAVLIGWAALLAAVYPDAWLDASTGPLATAGLAGTWMVGTLAIGRLAKRSRRSSTAPYGGGA